MSQETPTAKAIRLLGVETIAEACGLTGQAVKRWPDHIPSQHQRTVYGLAEERGVDDQLTPAAIIGVEA